MPDPDVIERIGALAHTALQATTFRHVSVGRQPLSGEGARIQGGRWNPPESFPTLYLARSRAVMAAEFSRLAARNGRSPGDFLPRELFRIEIRLHLVLDLTEPTVAAALDLPDAMSRADLRACQAIGDAAQHLGLEAIRAPSAAGPGTTVAVFTDRVQPTSTVTAHPLGQWTDPSDVAG